MTRTTMQPSTSPTQASVQPPLSALLSQSEDDFYGSLQRIWNTIVQLEDMGIIQQENEKFRYAYQFAEAELKKAYLERATWFGVQLPQA